MKQKDVPCFIGFLIYLSLTNAVPLSRQEREIFQGNSSSLATECLSEDILYKAGDEVPSPGPCEQCVCQPPSVACTMIKCKTNSGCKMIQRANHCCPDYMCDCEYKGRVYNNGERLELDDTSCQVCYCKGGEIMCTSITCYERTDCQPRYIPGQCCPKYDHCPLENNENNNINSTVLGSKREIQPWLMTKPVTVKPIEVLKQTTIKPDEHTQPNVYPQTLRIHEILPTTVKYERFPNGKRPVFSAVSKPPQEEIYVNEKISPGVEYSTSLSGDIVSSTEPVKGYSEEEKLGTASQFSMITSESLIQSSTTDGVSDSLSTTVNTECDTTPSAMENVEHSEAPVEFSTLNNADDFTTTDNNQSNLSYENITQENGVTDDKGNLVYRGTTNVEDVTPEVTDWRRISPTNGEIPSTESVQIRSVPSEGEFTNSIAVSDGLTPTDDTFTTYDVQFTNPTSNFESNLEDIEGINPTSSSFTEQTEPIVLSGGIYETINDTSVYTNENDVRQNEKMEDERIFESVPTTENPDKTSYYKSEYEPSTSALSEVFERFIDSPQSSLGNRRSDDWLSDAYQLIPGEVTDDQDEKLIDMNVGATSHSNRRVSPAYYYQDDSKESYILNGRSLSPLGERNAKENILEKLTTQALKKFDTELNKIVTEQPLVNYSSDKSDFFDNKSIKFNPNKHSDLYLYITGRNSSSNETILHMVLSPSDLKYLAEQLVKENIRSAETIPHDTEVKIEWLTQDQLSKLKPVSSSNVVINLTKYNLTGFAETKSEVNVNDELNGEVLNDTTLDLNSNVTSNIIEDKVTTEGSFREHDSETSTVSSTLNVDLPDATSQSYNSTQDTEIQNATERAQINNTTSDVLEILATKQKNSGKADTGTIKVYEIRQSADNNDRYLVDAYVTTDGPYTSLSSLMPSDNPSSQPSQRRLTDSETTQDASDESTDKTKNSADFETTTVSSQTVSEKPRKKNLPNVEPFLRQLPSTLDEKDVSILRDFLEKHLSETQVR